MAQPPTTPIMARELVRAVPFVTPYIYIGNIAPSASVSAEFDTVAGFADPNLYNSVGAYPGTNAPKVHAVGPYLDAGVYASLATSLLVEYAVDRGASYRAFGQVSTITQQTFTNISGLRITGRFVRVTLTNLSAVAAVAVEFGVYVRSA